MRREGLFASNGMAEPREAKMALTNEGVQDMCRRY